VLLFGGVLFPAFGFFDVYAMRYSYVADHFAYQAVAVAAASVVCACASLLEAAGPAGRRGAAAVAVGVLALLGSLTWRQSRAYDGPETLWLRTLERNPDCFMCHTNYGNWLLGAGRTDEAVSHLEQSLKIKPDAIPTLLNLARVSEQRGRFDVAASHLRAALAVDPSDAEMRSNLAADYLKAGRTEDAIREYEAVLASRSPSAFLAHNGLGVALLRAGRPEEGLQHLRECVRLRPDYEPGRANLERAAALVGALGGPQAPGRPVAR
jgi:Flp pilus assembly protein TadD